MIELNEKYVGCLKNPTNKTANNNICTQSPVMIPPFCIDYCYRKGKLASPTCKIYKDIQFVYIKILLLINVGRTVLLE